MELGEGIKKILLAGIGTAAVTAAANGTATTTATKATTLPHIRATFSGASPMDSAILISDDPNMMATYPQKSAEANASSAMPPL